MGSGRRWWIAAATVASCLLATACGSSPGTGSANNDVLTDDRITIGSFNFAESELLAELYAQALEAGGFRVDRQLALGPRELVMPALQRGLVELVPEYAGSALGFLGGVPAADPAVTHERLRAILAARRLVAMVGSPAEDQNGFAVTRRTADRYDLRELSDLAPVATTLTLGGPIECPDRPLCEAGLEHVYGLKFGEFVPVDAGGPLALEALVRGTVDVALLFTTDGRLDRRKLVLLRDDRGLQPAENVTPVIRKDALERFGPGVERIANAVSASFTTQALRTMNAAVDSGTAPADVARSWLETRSLLGG